MAKTQEYVVNKRNPQSDIDRIYRGFSCPNEDYDHAFFSLVVEQYATSLIELLLEHFEETVDPEFVCGHCDNDGIFHLAGAFVTDQGCG